jgi:arginase
MRMRENLTYIFVKSELGAGTWGASLGVEALQLAARNRESNILDRYPSYWVRHKFIDREVPTYAKNIGSLVKFYHQIADTLEGVYEEGGLPLIITGDHANAGGNFAGIMQAHPGKRLGVVWIDAHGDIHTPWTSPSGNVHGMPVAMALNLRRDPATAKNKVPPGTEKMWAAACEMGGAPKILPQDLVFIGIRDLEEEEWDVLEKKGIRYYTPNDLTDLGTHRVVDETLEQLSGCDLLYVSFDVDSLESEISLGTGTPVSRGLSVEQAVSILKRLWRDPRLCVFEVTEVNPLLDNRNKTAELVTEILEEIIDSAPAGAAGV